MIKSLLKRRRSKLTVYKSILDAGLSHVSYTEKVEAENNNVIPSSAYSLKCCIALQFRVVRSTWSFCLVAGCPKLHVYVLSCNVIAVGCITLNVRTLELLYLCFPLQYIITELHLHVKFEIEPSDPHWNRTRAYVTTSMSNVASGSRIV